MLIAVSVKGLTLILIICNATTKFDTTTAINHSLCYTNLDHNLCKYVISCQNLVRRQPLAAATTTWVAIDRGSIASCAEAVVGVLDTTSVGNHCIDFCYFSQNCDVHPWSLHITVVFVIFVSILSKLVTMMIITARILALAVAVFAKCVARHRNFLCH